MEPYQARCPGCNRYGSHKLGGWCKSCHTNQAKRRFWKEKPDQYLGHIGETYINDYDVSDPFVPDNIGLIKDKADIVR